MKFNRYLLPASLALLFGATAAHANDPNKDRDTTTGTQSSHTGTTGQANAASQQYDSQLFTRLDANSDGYLSDAELKADTSLDITFNNVDRDADDRISRGEWSSRDAKGQTKDDVAKDDEDY